MKANSQNLSTMDEEWKADAKCRDTETSVFFNDFEKGRIEDRKVILEFCNDCPVKQDCFDYGRKTHSYGVYGGSYMYRGKPLKHPLRLK